MVQKRPAAKPAAKPAPVSSAAAPKPTPSPKPPAPTPTATAPAATAPPPATAVAAARATFVDLSKLRKTSLKRYKKHFKLNVKADSKGELLAAVSAHFAAMPVREADVALEFHEFARAQRGKQQQRVEAGLVENGPAAAR